MASVPCLDQFGQMPSPAFGWGIRKESHSVYQQGTALGLQKYLLVRGSTNQEVDSALAHGYFRTEFLDVPERGEPFVPQYLFPECAMESGMNEDPVIVLSGRKKVPSCFSS